jgi:hypothetical protein
MTSSDAPEKTSNRRRGFFPDLPDWLAQLLYWPTFLWNYLLAESFMCDTGGTKWTMAYG